MFLSTRFRVVTGDVATDGALPVSPRKHLARVNFSARVGAALEALGVVTILRPPLVLASFADALKRSFRRISCRRRSVSSHYG